MDENFEKGATALRALLDAGAARILVAYPNIQVELIDDKDGYDELVQRQGTTSEVVSVAATQVTAAMEALVNDVGRGEYIESRRARDKETGDVAGHRYDIVEATFDIGALKRRVWVKRTSSTDVVRAINWEVSLRQSADGTAPVIDRPVPVATLSMRTHDPLAPFFLFDRARGSRVTVDLEDVEYMLDSFRRLRDALAAVGAES